MRNRMCTNEIRRGRLNKCSQFLGAAELIRDFADEDSQVADAYVTLCVHAGVAASDVICCARLGKFSQGEDHVEAVKLLSDAEREEAKHLRTLLNLKTKAGYSHMPATTDDCKRAAQPSR